MEKEIKIFEQCKAIFLEVSKDLKFIKDTALYDGFGGFVYFVMLQPEEFNLDLNKGDLLKTLFNSVENSDNIALTNFTLSSGLSGLGLMISQLKKMDYLESGEFEFNELIFQDALIELKRENIDLLHGAMGQLYYLNEVGYLGISEIDQIVEILSDIKIEDHLGVHFNNQTVREWQQTDNVNLSLSHGQIGMGLVLLDIYQNSNDLRIYRILRGMVDYLLNYIVISDNHSLFPLLIDPKLSKEELVNQQFYRENYSWCYGDFGVIIFLLRFCKIFPNHKANPLIQILCDNLYSRVFKIEFESLNMNSHLCHGSAGVLLCLKELCELDKDNNWYKVVDRFYDFTMRLINKDILDKTYLEKSKSKTVLEGIPGSLMAIWDYEGKMNAQWKSIFLLKEGVK